MQTGLFFGELIGAVFMELFHSGFKIGTHSLLFCSECFDVLIRDGEWNFDRDVTNNITLVFLCFLLFQQITPII